jgi:hypothetical protein
MMNWFQTARIAALLAVIFVAGVLTGRFTAPRPQTLYVTTRPGGNIVDFAVTRLSRQVSLTAEEQQKVRKVFEEMQSDLMRYPPMTLERLNVFRDYVPKIKAQLPAEKHAAVDRYFQDIQRRIESASRRSPKAN